MVPPLGIVAKNAVVHAGAVFLKLLVSSHGKRIAGGTSAAKRPPHPAGSKTAVPLRRTLMTPTDPSPDDTLPFPPPAVALLNEGDPSLPPGYLNMGVLGRGGSGVVSRAHELASGSTVAIKVISMSSPTHAAQVERELGLAAAIRHPNIVTIRSIITTHHGPCCVMELVDGPTFSTIVKSLAGQNAAMLALDRVCTLASIDRSKLKADLVARAVPPAPWYRMVAGWMLELCGAVQAAHGAGIIHRDIKPHNLLLTPDGTLKLTDFGAAAALDASSLATRHGTPRYLPPERLADLATRGSVGTGDRRVDLWGIGVCMYELLTLRPAFDAATVADALRAVATTDPIPPRQLNWSVPRELEVCCMRCLRRDPNERYADAASLATDLAAYLLRPERSSNSFIAVARRLFSAGGRA